MAQTGMLFDELSLLLFTILSPFFGPDCWLSLLVVHVPCPNLAIIRFFSGKKNHMIKLIRTVPEMF